jgi:hypothetical protein
MTMDIKDLYIKILMRESIEIITDVSKKLVLIMREARK